MHLEKIIEETVFASDNEENDITHIPSPDIPQASPSVPIQSKLSVQSEDILDSLNSEVSKILVENEFQETFNAMEMQSQAEFLSRDMKHATDICLNQEHSGNTDNAFQMSFFNEDDENLVITSQQALEMFESASNDNPCENSNILMKSTDTNSSSCGKVIEKNANFSIEEIPGVIEEQEPVQVYNEPVPVPELDNCENVPAAFAEVEIVATVDKNNEALGNVEYVTLRPVTHDVMGNLVSEAINTLVEYDDSTISYGEENGDIDNNPFVVYVQDPDFNMTASNEYPNNEKDQNGYAVDGYQEMNSQSNYFLFPPFENTQIASPSLETCAALQGVRPKHAIKENAISPQNKDKKSGKQHKKRAKSDGFPDSEAKKSKTHLAVMEALRKSILRSKAKKIVQEAEAKFTSEKGNTSRPEEKTDNPKVLNSLKKQDTTFENKEAEPAKDSNSDRPLPETSNSNTYHGDRLVHTEASEMGQAYSTYSQETQNYGNCQPRNNPKRLGHPEASEMGQVYSTYSQETQNYGNCHPRNNPKPNSFPRWRQPARVMPLNDYYKHGSSGHPPVFVMRPEDLANTDGDSLQVQLVYLVYPLDGKKSVPNAYPYPPPPHLRQYRDSSSFYSPHLPSQYASYPPPFQNSHYVLQPAPEQQNTPPPPFSLTSRNKTIHWLEESVPHPSSSSSSSSSHYSPAESSTQECENVEDDFKYKPILEWEYFHVVHFLLEVTQELGISHDNLDFTALKADTGDKLMQMEKSDFEVFAPTKGSELLRYFQEFKKNFVPTSPSQEAQQYHQSTLQSSQEPQHQFFCQSSPPPLQPFNQSSSPSSSYIPQGFQYNQVLDQPCHILDYGYSREHNLPTAARKTFSPLHSACYDDQFREDEMSNPDSASDGEIEPPPPVVEVPKKRGPGRPPKPENERKRKAKKTGRLWEFIRNLLLDPKTCPALIRWDNPNEGMFRFISPEKVAEMWGMRKCNRKMNYEKLSRAMRYYYKRGVFEPVLGKRLVYKFGPRAKNWMPKNPNFEN